MSTEIPRDTQGHMLDVNEWRERCDRKGLCICGNQLYEIRKNKIFSKTKIPITNDRVRDGRCLDCNSVSTDITGDIEDSEKLDHDGRMKTRTRQRKKNVKGNRENEERRRMQGYCTTCPNKLYKFEENPENPLHRIIFPITNSRVRNGHCLDCDRKKTNRHFTPTTKKTNEDGEGTTSDSEAQTIRRNPRSNVDRNSRAGIFSSGTFADNMLHEVADEINEYNYQETQSPQIKQRISRNGSNVSLQETNSERTQLEMETPQSFHFRKSLEWNTTEPLSKEHYDHVANTILLILTKSLAVGEKHFLIEDLLFLVHDKAVKAEILFSGGILAIHKIMTEDIDDESLQLKTLTLLKNIIPISPVKFLEEAPLVKDILKEMVRHETCLEIQENAITCLIEILKKGDKYKSIINHEGGINVMLSTLERHAVEDGNLLITSLME